jgi:hypothetical protein
MSRWDAIRHGLFCVLFAAVGAKAEDENWDARFRQATEACLLKSMKNVQCIHEVDGNPLEHASAAEDVLYDVGSESLFRGVGEAVKTVSAADALIKGDESAYWRRLNSEYNYETLKKFARYRARKDRLESCQTACLATCITSQIMEFDERNLLTHWTEALGREKGVCRDFSGMAADLMRSMGLKARDVSGTVYEISDGQPPKSDGGHAMVEVDLPNGRFTMEPQLNACVFYDREFSHGVRHLGERILNLKGTPESIER